MSRMLASVLALALAAALAGCAAPAVPAVRFANAPAVLAVDDRRDVPRRPEQRTIIKDYVVKEKIRPHKLQSRVTVGATLPADVELAPVPETWGPSFRSYRYVYTGDDVVLVDPSSRRVVQVID